MYSYYPAYQLRVSARPNPLEGLSPERRLLFEQGMQTGTIPLSRAAAAVIGVEPQLPDLDMLFVPIERILPLPAGRETLTFDELRRITHFRLADLQRQALPPEILNELIPAIGVSFVYMTNHYIPA